MPIETTSIHQFSLLMPHHDKNKFSCGIEALDVYLKTKANQDAKKGISVTYILHDEARYRTIGYYTLASASIQLEDLPEDKRKKLPRYPSIPASLIGRLAIDQTYQSQGFGRLLLMDAFYNIQRLSKQVGVYAVTVDAVNQEALNFYQKFGFTCLLEHEKKLFLSMKTIEQLDLE